jgi:hypothetical protein
MTTMKHLLWFCLALGMAAGSAPLAAQPTGLEDPALREAERPFASLMRHRAELGLTDEQVGRLQAIRAELETRNGPLRRQLMQQHQRWREERRAQLERMSPTERRAELRRLRERPAEQRVPADMQPVVRQMRVNLDEAMGRAQGVLTAEQRVRARAILRRELREQREARPRPRPGVRPGARPGARHPAGRLERRAEVAERRAMAAERRAVAAERMAEAAERRAEVEARQAEAQERRAREGRQP